jgi:aryl-alcohol dehydrogenase-like predicted oxidoreductase
VLQVACSLFDRRLVDAGLFERAAVRDIEIHVRSVFLQGVAHLAPTDLPAGLTRLQAPLGAVQSWEHANGVSRGTAWVQYARRLSRASLVLGCERVEQLEGNLASMWLPPLADEEVERLCALVGQLPVELIQPSCWPDHGPVVTKP